MNRTAAITSRTWRGFFAGLLATLHLCGGALAEDVYLTPEGFLLEVFDSLLPDPAVIWLRGETKQTVEEILGHRYGGLRIKYWEQGQRSAWILEEIGKYQPITAGFVVNGGRIERVEVLIYRESIGWEVRYPFFTDQFRGLFLTEDHSLSDTIDNISGATLSVNALRRLGRLALFLHAQARSAAE